MVDGRVERVKARFRGAGAEAGRVVELGAVDRAALAMEDAESARLGETTLRYGVGRDVALREEDGRWSRLVDAGGEWQVWTAEVVARGAMGLRVLLSEMNLPANSCVCVYAPGAAEDVAGPYEGRGPYGTGEVWAPTRWGERVRVEYRVQGNQRGPVPLSVRRVQHIYRNPMDSGCYSDAACSAAWSQVAKACVGLGFVGQNSLFCSGQMISTQSLDLTPYVLTANQCVNTPGAAQTCELFFDYITGQCDGPVPALSSLPRTSGCTLLTTQGWTNSTLLLVNGALPANRSWAGWTTSPVPVGQGVGSVHFAGGEPARLSLGVRAATVVCGGTGHLRGVWSSGPTGPGSAGGGLFLDDATNLLVGVLSCGSSACGTPGSNDFGAFASFYPQVAAALANGPDDGFEPNNRCGGSTAVVPGVVNGLVVKLTDEDWYSAVVEPGAQLTLQTSFTHAHGDIDLELYTSCEEPPAVVSAGQSGVETVTWTNSSSVARLVEARVFLSTGTRNTYSLTVANGVPIGQGACCLPSGSCSVATSAACGSLGGVYAGDGRNCGNACEWHSYTGPAVSIADGTAVCGVAAAASVFVPGGFAVAGVGVGARITHPYQGDLKLSLRHVETGRVVSLVDRPGVPQTPFGFPNDNYGASESSVFWSVDGAAQKYDVPVVGVDNVSGPWKSEGALAGFAGEAAGGTWQLLVQDCALGETGSIVSFRLTLAKGQSGCYANCDGSTGSPLLTGNDFQCFINRYAVGSSLANCDGSTAIPVLTGNDFQCFIDAYAAGCS